MPRLEKVRTVYPAEVRVGSWGAQDSGGSARPLRRMIHWGLGVEVDKEGTVAGVELGRWTV